jgi:hypothetical protein
MAVFILSDEKSLKFTEDFVLLYRNKCKLICLIAKISSTFLPSNHKIIAINVPVAIAQKRGDEFGIMVSILADLTPVGHQVDGKFAKHR